MFQTMFDRLLALFMCVILLVVLISGAFSLFSIRSAMIDSRMEGLLMQAREIAFLASRVDDSSIADYLNIQSSTMAYLQWKARTVYEDYGAYILIVDRNGRVMDNMQSAIEGSVDALQTLDAEDMSAALIEVLSGREVQTQITHEILSAQVGKRETVLVESLSARDDGWVGGKTPRGHMVNFPGKADLIGRLVKVEILSAGRNTLRGRQITEV